MAGCTWAVVSSLPVHGRAARLPLPGHAVERAVDEMRVGSGGPRDQHRGRVIECIARPDHKPGVGLVLVEHDRCVLGQCERHGGLIERRGFHVVQKIAKNERGRGVEVVRHQLVVPDEDVALDLQAAAKIRVVSPLARVELDVFAWPRFE